MSTPGIVAGLLISFVLAPVTRAQLSEKEAVKQFDADLKVVLADFKLASTVATSTALGHIAAITSAVSAGSDPERELAVLFGDLVTMQTALKAALDTAELALATAGSEALAALQGPPGLDGVYPARLYAGGSGSEARARASLDKQLVKTTSKVSKALQKTAKTLGKTRGLALTALVLPVEPTAHLGFMDNGVIDSGVTNGKVTIDVVLGWGALDVLGDVQLCMAGSGGGAMATWACRFGCTAGKPVADENRRWQWCTPVSEGNYVLAVADDQGGDGGDPGATLSLGFR
jgi:hypothetical protein